MTIISSPTELIPQPVNRPEHPPFEPHPWIRSPHAQTIIGRYWPSPSSQLAAIPREVVLPDGDRLVVLDSRPNGWTNSAPTAVLVHGLAGDAEASYLIRLGSRLTRRGVRVVRVNLRNSGIGFGLAKRVYHAGRSDDLRAVLAWLKERDGMSPVALVGYSLGGNLVLKLAAEAALDPTGAEALDCVIASNPPIDLTACSLAMRDPTNRLYDRNFVKWLRRMVCELHRRIPELGPSGIEDVQSVLEFDDRYTSRRNGFASAHDYYQQCTLVGKVGQIKVPGLVVHAMDDPFVPHEPFQKAEWPSNVELQLVAQGGHLGYVSRYSPEGGRRWLDSRLERWLADHWSRSALSPTIHGLP